jgi:hypothetical protein
MGGDIASLTVDLVRINIENDQLRVCYQDGNIYFVKLIRVLPRKFLAAAMKKAEISCRKL